MTDAIIDGVMDIDEVQRRLPEVGLIADEDVHTATVDAIQRGVPDYFWDVPATGSGRYHNPFARRKHGLWVHTKQVCTVYERLVDSYVQQGRITEFEANCGRSACLLHDMLKYGQSYEDGKGTLSNHDMLAGHWLSHNSDVPSEVVGAVKSHNGPWYDGPRPQTELEQLVHIADMAASTKNVTVGVYEPAREIAERYPNIPRADL